jgi:putative colanic acid biosynthesis UDP-glucose lipid carrier transferase
MPALVRQRKLGQIHERRNGPTHAALRTGNRGLVRVLGSFVIPAVAPLVLLVAMVAWGESPSRAYALLGVLTFFILYPGRWSTSTAGVDSGRQVILPWAVALMLLAGIGYASGSLQFFSARALATWIVFTPLLQIMVLHLLPAGMARLVALRRDKHRVVIVGANEVGLGFAKALNANPIVHSKVTAFFDDRAPARDASRGRAQFVGAMDQLPDYLSRERVDQIYIALPMSSQPRIVRQLNQMRDCTASVYFLPDLLSIDLIQPRLDTHGGFPVVSVCESPFNGVDGAVKRGMDLVLASAAIVALAPLMATIAVAVKLTSPGPVLFRQRRFGLDGSEILVWKFRSMTVTEDGASSYTQVVRGDARLTKIGSFLRKMSLDELPQFFNVLQGRMSIVGPRPHALMVNEQYRRRIPGYMIRHKVRPGITGWAQVHGYRGGNDLESMMKRIEFDIEYLRRWSLWMDIKILFKTMSLVMKDSRAF